LEKMGFDSGIQLSVLLDAAEEIVSHIMPGPIVLDRDNILSGYAGVYNSFLLHVKAAAEKYDVSPTDILMELGKRHAIAGQEDWIIDVAIELSKKKMKV